MKRLFVYTTIFLLISSLQAQNIYLNEFYSLNEPFINSALNAKYDYFQNGIITTLSPEKFQSSLWSAGPVFRNFNYSLLATYGKLEQAPYMNISPGIVYRKKLKNSWNMAAATNLDFSRNYMSYTMGGVTVTETTNTQLIHLSLALFNEKYSFALATENIPIGPNPYEYPMSLTVYADVILANAIKTYSLNPSIYLNISRYPFLGININTVLTNTVLIGCGIKNNFMISPFYYYLDFWLQGGFKFKKYFYLYLRLHDIMWTNPVSIYSPDFNLALKINIYKRNNAIPRYF